ADGAACGNARGDLYGRSLYGRHDLYRQCAELHDLCHRGGARHQDAEFFRLYALLGSRAAAGFHPAHFRLAGEGRLAARVVRPLFVALEVDLGRAAAGNAATASISISAPSRARPEIAMVVLAGRFSAAR